MVLLAGECFLLFFFQLVAMNVFDYCFEATTVELVRRQRASHWNGTSIAINYIVN